MTRLRLSPDLTLPLDVVTRRLAILAMSGAGKSNVAVVLAEQMYDAGIPWVAIDPKGDWYGVRSSADGKSAGLPIPIFGGLHGDLPLEAGAGAYIANLIVEHRLTCIVDVSEFAVRQDMWKFLADFGETLLRRNREALHLFLEECDDYIPQKAGEGGNLNRCKGVWQRVVKRGRFRGLGSSQISQRSATIDKDTLYQAEVLIALRSTGKGDRQAVAGWVEHHNAAAEVVASLPTLADGVGWVSSPAWLHTTVRVAFNRRRTFDSGATPVLAGGKKAPAPSLADIDLAAIRREMAATIERTKADDPRELRKRIAELERLLDYAKKMALAPVEPPAVVRVEVPVLKATDSLELAHLRTAAESLVEAANGIRDRMASAVARMPAERPGREAAPPRTEPARRPAAEPRARAANGGLYQLAAAESAFLTVLARRRGKPTRRNQLAVFAGYSAKSRHVDNTIAALRSRGYAEGGRDDLRITSGGVVALGDHDPLPTGEALVSYWERELGAAGGAMLRQLVDVYPRSMARDELADATGYSPTSRHVDNTIASLRTRELVTGGRGDLRASEELFE